MKLQVLLILCLLNIFFVACASKKEVKSSAMPEVESSFDKQGLVLNGESDNNKAGGLRTVHFGYASSALTASSKKILKENADFLKGNDSINVSIEGHCDERGGRQYNLALGERRAAAIRNHLMLLGILKKRMSIISYGNERPITEGHEEKFWNKNRRANFVITSL